MENMCLTTELNAVRVISPGAEKVSVIMNDRDVGLKMCFQTIEFKEENGHS